MLGRFVNPKTSDLPYRVHQKRELATFVPNITTTLKITVAYRVHNKRIPLELSTGSTASNPPSLYVCEVQFRHLIDAAFGNAFIASNFIIEIHTTQIRAAAVTNRAPNLFPSLLAMFVAKSNDIVKIYI